MVVNGRARGLHGSLLRIHESQFNCDVRLTADLSISAATPTQALVNLFSGRELVAVEYEDVSKLATEEELEF